MSKHDNQTGKQNAKFNKNVQDAEKEFQNKMHERKQKNSHMSDMQSNHSYSPNLDSGSNNGSESTKEASASKRGTEKQEHSEKHQHESLNKSYTDTTKSHDHETKSQVKPYKNADYQYKHLEDTSQKSKTAFYGEGHFNKNVQDAQREYDEKMHRRPEPAPVGISSDTLHTQSSDSNPFTKKDSESFYRKNEYDSSSSRTTKETEETAAPSETRSESTDSQDKNPFSSYGTAFTNYGNHDSKLLDDYKAPANVSNDSMNKNVRDAQREYDEKMHAHPVKESNIPSSKRDVGYSTSEQNRNPSNEYDSSSARRVNHQAADKKEESISSTRNPAPYMNKNVKDAQREYNEKMHARPVKNQGTPDSKGSVGDDVSKQSRNLPNEHGTEATRRNHKDSNPSREKKDALDSGGRRVPYINKNVKDAQREYDAMMHSRPDVHNHYSHTTERTAGDFVSNDKEDQTRPTNGKDRKGQNARGFGSQKRNVDFKVPDMFPSRRQRTIMDIKNPDEFFQKGEVSEIDLNDIPAFKGKTPTSIGHKIARIERQFARLGIHFGEATATQGSNTAIGYRFSKELGAVAAMTIINNTKVTLSNSMNYVIGRHMDQYYEMVKNIKNQRVKDLAFIGRPRSAKDINRMIYSLNILLKEQGYPPIKGSGKIGIVNALKILNRHKGKMTPEMQEVYKLIVKLFQNQTMMQGGGRFTAIRRFGMQKFRRYAMQCNAGQGLIFTATVTARALNTLRMGWGLVKATAKMAHLATLTAAKAAAWAAAKVAKTKMAARIADKGKDIVVKHVSEGARKTVKKGAQNLKKGSGKLGNLFKRARIRYNEFRIDPFHIKGGTRRVVRAAGKKFWNSKFGKKLMKPVKLAGRVFNPFRIIGNFIGRVVVMVSTIISTIISMLLLVLAMIIFAFISAIIVAIIAESVIQWFDFSLNEDEIKRMALDQIKSCYEAQNNQIQGYYSQYRNVSVSYIDQKNNSIYDKYKPEVAFTETTNSAELLCMAQVYFDFDLESAGEYAVKDYIRQLYNGSHLLEVIEHPYTYKDKDGKEITYVDAEINLVTYYFDTLFDAKLSNSGGILQTGTIAAGTEITIPTSIRQCVTVTCYDKWVYEWGVSPGTGQRKVSDKWKEQGGKFDNGIAYIEVGGQKRYLIALVDTFGVCGDYVDIHLSDGSVFPCIIADMKSRNDPNISDWGHITGNATSILEVEVQTSYYRKYGNPGSSRWWPELGNDVVKIVNGGSMFSYPNGPVSPTTPETPEETPEA